MHSALEEQLQLIVGMIEKPRGAVVCWIAAFKRNMLLTISYTGKSATDLGYLLHKSPFRVHSFDQVFGKGHVFYPETTPDRCTAGLLLDMIPSDSCGTDVGRAAKGTL
jgi:hypothetical protein